ncbi:MAG: hypothetical protein ACLQGV_15330 [Bryobacteraceae bacterium]
MSFDLYFCRQPGSEIDIAKVRRHVIGLEHTTESRSDDGRLVQFEYSNPATGVYCLFDLMTGVEMEQEEPLVLPDSYVNTGLSVSINFLRPHFFALELVPIVSGVADYLGLSLYDPQEDRLYAPGTPSNMLIQTWIAHNERATQALAQDDEPIRMPYLPRQQSLYWWQYARAREALQSRLGEDVFVPSILLMADDQERVKLTVVWSAVVQRRAFRSRHLPLPQVFPKCDYLILAWRRGDAEEMSKAVVPYSTVIAPMANLLEDIDGPVDGIKILRPARQVEASSIYSGLLKDGSLDEMKRIAADDFVDVVPS